VVHYNFWCILYIKKLLSNFVLVGISLLWLEFWRFIWAALQTPKQTINCLKFVDVESLSAAAAENWNKRTSDVQLSDTSYIYLEHMKTFLIEIETAFNDNNSI